MRILHIVADGYHPLNSTPLFSNIEEILAKYSHHEVFDTKHPYHHNTIISRDAWCKIYTKLEPKEHDPSEYTPEDYGRRRVRSTVYGLVNPDRFIWSKISKMNIPCYIFPFQVFKNVIYSNFLSGSIEGRENVTGDLLPYNSDKYYTIEKGEIIEKFDLCHPYSIWSEHFDKNKASANSYFEHIHEVWDRPSMHAEEMPKWWRWLKENSVAEVLERAEMNKEIFEQILYPRLEKFSNLDDVYLHVSLVEADGFYHFFDNFLEERDRLREEFFNPVLQRVIDICKADVVILTGDHGMANASFARNKHTEFDVDGQHIKCIKSNMSESLLKMLHTTTQGALIMTNENCKSFISDVNVFMSKEENIIIGDAIYDSILNNIDK